MEDNFNAANEKQPPLDDRAKKVFYSSVTQPRGGKMNDRLVEIHDEQLDQISGGAADNLFINIASAVVKETGSVPQGNTSGAQNTHEHLPHIHFV